jgi:hypothetical protein
LADDRRAYGAPTEFKSNAKIGEWDLTEGGYVENTIHQTIYTSK